MSLYRRLFPVLIMGFGTHASMAQMPTAAESDMMLLYENEEVVEIATGTAKPIHLAPSVASVITAKDIKAMGWRTLDEALESVPGLHVSRSYNRLNSLYSIRGIHTGDNAQVLLLVNGVPFNNIVDGNRPPMFRLPAENIARIEIIRGPGSAVFGADAFAGVINVITKEASDIDGIQIGARAGSFDTQDAWVQDGTKIGQWDVALSVEYSHSDGDRDRIITSDLQTSLDGSFGTSASLAPGALDTRYDLLNTSITASHDGWKLWFNSWNLDDAGVGPGAAQALDPYGSQQVDQYTLAVDYTNDHIASGWALDSRFAYRNLDQQAQFRLLPPGTVVLIGADGNLFTPPGSVVAFPEGIFGNPGGEAKHARLEIVLSYRGFANHLTRMALGYDGTEFSAKESKNFGPGVIDGTVSPIGGTVTDVTGTQYVFSPDVTRQVRYISLQDEWQLAPDWELTAGMRFDDYSDFGSTTNPRLALVWATDYNLTTKLLYGSAFRAPSVNELYFQNNPVVIGNPNLKPETIDMLELVFDYRPTFELQTILSFFGYQAKDLIEFVNGTAQNQRNQKGQGAEFEASWQTTDKLMLKANYSLQYSEDMNTGAIIADAPRRQAFVGAQWKFMPAWAIGSQVKWIAERVRAAGDARSTIGDYTLVDAALRYQHEKTWELSAGVHNLFDQDAREPSNGTIPDDYPLEGRAAYLEARYHFD